ncbi:predicted protein [Chaetomium globosum CBS 148.51]|uniref:ATP-dependent DNA helicase n=1 Tax=Chaetomium globosum (strain ATCC 6205 / CBS 148.51 / DSM 1962 / NBRC 6347 / NRRL 1970) TaxID=306901 RepID=Q2GN93_CHAGB|nr:uncharacterized protein CHGG_10561 [Chaetomium globosum CBS 148.51]EAQ84157.1 predicted protein [Chaetomium globosum CBS 148.51]
MSLSSFIVSPVLRLKQSNLTTRISPRYSIIITGVTVPAARGPAKGSLEERAGAADHGVVGKLPTGSDDFGVGVLLVDGEFCRMSSQLSARITRIRKVGSTFRGPWIRSRSRTPRSRPLHAIHDPLGKGFAAVRIHPARDFQGCWSTGKRTRHVAYVYAFARRAVVLWLQPGPAPAQNNGAYGVKPPSLGSVSATCTEWVSSVSYLLTPTPWKNRKTKTSSTGLALRDREGDDDGVGLDGGDIDPQAHYEAFLNVLSAVRGSEIKDMTATSALRRLDQEARAVDPSQDDNNAAQRGRYFYTMLQDLQDSPFRGMGLPSREEIDAVLKVQKKEDSNVTAKIQGRQTNPSSAHVGEPHGSPRLPVHGCERSPEGSMAVLLPAAFLDERGTRLQEEGGRQHFQYIGGEGGTGKSRVIHAIKDMFRLKDGLHTLLLTGASGNAAALIGGVTLHSAANIAFEGRAATAKNVSEEEKLRWKNMIMLVIDEISQFDPVLQTSLLLPTPRDPGGQRPDSSAKHLAAHKLVLQFANVVILREQVRAAGCARLRGFLRRLRSGEQTELDFQRLSQRVYTPSCESSFVDGMRAITPLNQDRWDLNMAAVVQWARAHGKHISVFAAKHDTESGKRLSAGDLCHVLRYGDDSQLPTPGLFFYAQGMPVVVTRNQFVGLKVVNGAPFKAVDIFPDLAAGTIALASDVTLHLGPPVAVLLESDDSAGLAIPGLPNGTILIKSKTVAIPSQMRGKEGRWRGKPGFRWVTHRTGPLCTPAFAMTDQKSQGKQFSNVLVNLKGVHSSGTVTRPSFMSLYVQLSRAQSWDGLHLFRKPGRGDFIEPKNVLDKDMREAILKLERRGEETRRRFEQDHRHESWFQEWAAMPESGQGTETDDVEDAALWRDPGVSELRS